MVNSCILTFFFNGQYVSTIFNGYNFLLLLLCKNLISEIAFLLARWLEHFSLFIQILVNII